jgi:hypothetical protein
LFWWNNIIIGHQLVGFNLILDEDYIQAEATRSYKELSSTYIQTITS